MADLLAILTSLAWPFAITLAWLAGGERCELLLSDVALGAGMPGTELARQVQARWPGMAVLLMSGYAAERLQTPDAAAAPVELLHKPYGRRELAQAMARVLAARGPASAPR